MFGGGSSNKWEAFEEYTANNDDEARVVLESEDDDNNAGKDTLSHVRSEDIQAN